ncbi:MAG TPA: type II toxin-antitoxin system VapC family toxin [Pseudonocardiaceae bacterium]|nr:type II toxin-antitoxin system VapC family toxin [Pseudonocardiaceae bacterium]
MKLLDTSVAVDHLRGYGPATTLLEGLVRSTESVVASELTRFELLAGARRDERDRLEDFFSVINWVPVTEDVARRAGEYARVYRRSPSGIGVVDYLLAGTVSAVEADLVTINVRHFPMFGGLRPPYDYGPPEQRRTSC